MPIPGALSKKRYNQAVTWTSNPLHRSTSYFPPDQVDNCVNVSSSVLYLSPNWIRDIHMFLVAPRWKLDTVV